MGQWLYRKALDHKCVKPGIDTAAQIGDIWQCDCGLMYRIKKINYGDQRDPGRWPEWEPHFGQVPKQSTGGRQQAPEIGVTSWRDR